MHDVDLSQRAAVLRAMPFFSGLAKATLFELSRRTRVEERPAGATLARVGDCDHAMSIIVSGTAAVRQEGGTYAEIGAGDYFGELCMIGGLPYEVDVTATTEVTLLVVEGTDFDDLLKVPHVMRAVMTSLASRLREPGLHGPGDLRAATPDPCDTCRGP
jgi:CRP-like cAMP-binding protein